MIASNQNFRCRAGSQIAAFDARATELNLKIQQQQTDSLRIKAGNDSYRREQIERLEALRARRKGTARGIVAKPGRIACKTENRIRVGRCGAPRR